MKPRLFTTLKYQRHMAPFLDALEASRIDTWVDYINMKPLWSVSAVL